MSGNIVGIESISGLRGRLFVGAMRAVGSVIPFGKFRPASAILARLGRLLLANNDVTVKFAGGGRFSFALSDAYWLKILMPGWHYEPEVESIFAAAGASGQEVFVVDCGANIGYWAALNSRYANFTTTALEPSPTVLPRLEQNLTGLSDRVTLRKNAIWSTPGEIVSFAASASLHAGSAVNAVSHHDLSTGDWHKIDVETTTIDKVCADDRPADASLTIVKLDVEGAETAAIDGSAALMKGDDFLLIYEDHPTDKESTITRKLLGLGLDIWSNGPEGLRQIRSVNDISQQKAQSIWVYRFCNFIALRPGGTAESLVDALLKAQGSKGR